MEHLLSALPGGQIGFLIFVNVLIFVLAFFLDFFELAFILVPLVGPVANKLGIDLIWFGVLLCVNMQTSFMHPPFGFALFYLRGISDTLYKNGSLPAKVESKDIYLGAIPWVLMQLILVLVVIFVPATVTSMLDKTEAVDMNKATEMLEQVDVSGGYRADDAKDLKPDADGKPGEAKEDDPMAAFKDLPKDTPKDGEKKAP